jgi:hypothetical protein
MEEKTDNRKAETYRVGLVVLILLAAMTIGEYFIGAIAVGWTEPLWGIAILKAWLIMRDYMHFPRLFAGEEETQS